MNIVDSIKINPADLDLLKEKVFVPITQEQSVTKKQPFSFRMASYGFLSATLLFSVIFFYNRTRRANLQPAPDNGKRLNEPNNHPMITYTRLK